MITESFPEKHIRIFIDSKLTFENHVKKLFKKAGKKIFMTVLPLLTMDVKFCQFYRRKLLMNAFL